MITEVLSKSVVEDIINRLVKRYGYAVDKGAEGMKLLSDKTVVFTAQRTNNSMYVVKYLPEAKVFSVR